MKRLFRKSARTIIPSFVLGGIAATALSLVAAVLVEHTGDDAFCGKCHEMDVYCETWKTSTHGTAHKGIEVAKCVDCHLPHTGPVRYLFAKAKTGMHDTVAHLRGIKPGGIESLEDREEYTFESGCLQCHKELVAPGISLKAFTAHRDYLTGETTKTCISCHTDVGHGDLKSVLMEQEAHLEQSGGKG